MSTRLPIVISEPEEKFLEEFNTRHQNDHYEFISWINSLAEAVGVNINITYSIVPTLSRDTYKEFLYKNYIEHNIFNQSIYEIGINMFPPRIVLPKNHSDYNYEWEQLQLFVANEYDIHLFTYNALEKILG